MQAILNILLHYKLFLAQIFSNEAYVNYGISLSLPIHPAIQPASRVATGRWPVGSLMPSWVMAPQSG